MLESIPAGNIFEYKRLSKEEQQRRGILGRLVGVMADSKNPTRNGRKYSAELWEKVFSNPIMQEKIKNRVCFGEACHPADGREEVDPEKVAICLAEVPKMNNKGQLIGVFDVLDTPCGRILKTMLDYGANIGVSSRGSGDVEMGFDGEESVNPDTYDCVCWDAVFVPAVKEARLQLVTESLHGKTLKQALTESINSANVNEQKVMKETLDTMNIKLNEDINDESLNIQSDLAVDDDKARVNELQEALKENSELTNTIISLQEKLSVSYAKEAKLERQINKYYQSISKLSESANKVGPLESRVQTLTEELEKYKEKLNNSNSKVFQLRENIKSNMNEDSAKEVEIQRLNEAIERNKIEFSNERNALNEQLADVTTTLEIKTKEYSQKVSKANKLVEQYKSIATKAVDRYIETKARMLGVDEVEIKNKLSESYSFDEIDQVCDNLRDYQLNISKLPFRAMKEPLTENIKITATPSKNESILPANGFDDDVDAQLLSLAGLN